MGKRQVSSDHTRARILEAARKLFADESNPVDFSMENIARIADVSRLTIYYQFNSRPGLLEALYDHLALRGNMHQMAQVFHQAGPSPAFEKLIRTFVNFWSSDPVVIRRLRAMAALDQEIGAGIRARDSRRVHLAGEILRRSALCQHRKYRSKEPGLIPDIVSMLTSFETYDALSRAGQNDENIVSTILSLVRAAIAAK